MTRGRAGKQVHVGMDMHDAQVVRTRQLSPHVVRVTFGSRTLRRFRDDGPDQRFKLFLPLAGQDRPLLPAADRWYEQWLRMPHDVRPTMRTYTIRAARPARGEVDVDMVVHEHGGPGSSFARRAAPGDRVGIHGAYAEYEPPGQDGGELIVGDLSALPAIAAITEHSDAQRVLIELQDLADASAFDSGAASRVQWVQADPVIPGRALLQAVQALPALPPPTYAWLAGEQTTVARLRRHAVRDRGLRPGNVMFMGYWRRGGAIDPG